MLLGLEYQTKIDHKLNEFQSIFHAKIYVNEQIIQVIIKQDYRKA